MAKKITTEDFIYRAKLVHGDRFDYSKSIYTGAKAKLIIICKLHGIEFNQQPSNHTQGKIGCHECEPKLKRYPVINGIQKCSKCGEGKAVCDFHNGSKKCKVCAINDARNYQEIKATSNEMTMLRRASKSALALARKSESDTYISPLPCKNGHIGLRFTKSQNCCKCSKERQLSRYDRDAVKKKKRSSVKRTTARNLGINHYTTGEPCKHGHLSPRLVSTRQCVECLKLRKQDRATKASPEAQRRSNARKRKQLARAKQRKYQSEVLFSRPDYRMRVFMRGCLTRLMAFKDGNKTAKLLGYSRFDLMKRIEFQFKDGMNWGNYGEWHIDHKKPLARFISQGITDPKIVNALSNLQPLWAKDNISKGDKF